MVTGGSRESKDEGAETTEEGRKRVPGVRMPWNREPSYYKNGKSKTRGWHRVGEGKTNILANFAAAIPVTVSQDHHCSIRTLRY